MEIALEIFRLRSKQRKIEASRTYKYIDLSKGTRLFLYSMQNVTSSARELFLFFNTILFRGGCLQNSDNQDVLPTVQNPEKKNR